jgi:hypothetical protein
MLDPADRLPELPDTKHRDYILTDYAPRCEARGRLHPASLLKHALREASVLDAWWPICLALREHLGPEQIVWGAKWGPSGFSVELYFYNFVKNGPQNRASCARLNEVLKPFAAVAGAVDEALPYFMCSLELTHARPLGPWRIYLGSGDRHRIECGFSYRAETEGLVLENHYWFYQAASSEQREDFKRRVEASPRAGLAWESLVPAALLDCYTLCFAAKPRSDGLYYSRISTEQLEGFLRGKSPLADVLRAHLDDFAHLSWDLGFDFSASKTATRIDVPKLAVHGVL